MKEQVAVGIDIGGTNSIFGLVNRDGECVATGKVSTRSCADQFEFFETVAQAVKDLINSMGPRIEVVGIGLGAPNGNYYTGTVDNAPNLNWKGVVPLRKMFEKEFNMLTILTNDANAAAVGEMIYGKAKGMKNFIVITLGTGLGSGFVANGKVVYGHDGFAGELGHIIVEPNGRKHQGGRDGILEAYVSATGIVSTAREFLDKSDKKSILRDVPSDELNSKIIGEAASKGDALALEVFDFTCQKLGKALGDAVSIMSPEAIFLFGGLAKSHELIIPLTKKYMEESIFYVFRDKIDILPSGLLTEQNAAVLGASAMVWDELMYRSKIMEPSRQF